MSMRRYYGAECVGERLQIEWNDGEWFSGTVKAFNAASDEHHVLYDDRDQRWYNLGLYEQSGLLRWLAPTTTTAAGPQPPPPAERKREAVAPPPLPPPPTAPPPSSFAATIRYDNECIGRRLCILWDDGDWFEGVVKAFDATSDEHHIVYKDGDQKWHKLVEEERCGQLRWLDNGIGGGGSGGGSDAGSSSTSTAHAAAQRPAPKRQRLRKQPTPQMVETATAEVPIEKWHTSGHKWIGARARRTIWQDNKRSSLQVIDGTITRWLPAEGQEPALWHMSHDDSDEEDLEAEEASEAVLAWKRDRYSKTLQELICEYVGAGVRYVDEDDGTVTTVHERLPSGVRRASDYFASRDVYVGNMYGHVDTCFYLGSNHARHHTTSCRDPYVRTRYSNPRSLPRTPPCVTCLASVAGGGGAQAGRA